MTALDAALDYAARGYRVLPVEARGKRPLLHDWPNAATTDAAIIREWWRRTPDANVGIATGSGIEVVDEDQAGALARFDLPVTVEARTPKGRHLHFKANGTPLRNRVRAIDGVDVRSDGGFVVAPPSVNATGTSYTWTHAPGTVEIAEMPADLRAALAGPSKPMQRPASVAGHAGDAYGGRALEDEAAAVRTAPEGARNATLNRAAFSLGQLVGGGILDSAIVEAALTEAARTSGLGDAEIAATLASGIGDGIAHPRAPEPSAKPTETAPPAEDLSDFEEVQPIERPEIRYTTEVHEMVDASETALIDHAEGKIFQKAGGLVRPVTDGRPPRGLKRAPSTPTVGLLPDASLSELLGLCARWTKYSRQRQQWEAAPPHERAVRTLAARGTWRFQHLDSVIETPTITRDGTVIDRPGYHEDLRVLYRPNVEFPPVPSAPTKADAQDALLLLTEPLLDFPMRERADLSSALSGILTLVVGPAIDGARPMHVIRKNAPGVGGSLLVDVISTIALGRPAARTTMTNDGAELRKLLFTIALEGDPIALFDNLEGAIGNPELCAALTSNTVSDRLLGVNRKPTVTLRTTFFGTGNGLSFRRDAGRRIVLCDLWTRDEHPEDRTGFKHPDILGYVATKRPELVVAALTIVRAWIVAGAPPHGRPKKGMFEGWDDLVRAPLLWAGAKDPRDPEKRIRGESDEDLSSLRTALEVWRETFPHAVTCGTAVDRAHTLAHGAPMVPADTALRDALVELCRCEAADLSAKKLGYILRQIQGRPSNGRAFFPDGTDRLRGLRWSVKDA